MAVDISVLIPARNEEWLSRTVESVCSAKRGNTDVIVVLDGAWAEPGLPVHPDVHVVYLPTAIGQRAATNLAARLSDARYVMKLDGHCIMADGFDVELLKAAEELGPHVTQIPAQKHLHVFDYVCDVCAKRFDQSPAKKECPNCKGALRREIVWEPRQSPTTTAWRFDSELHFQYFNGARSKQRGIKYPEVMSCLGACWFLERDWYLNELGGMDEGHGSWGAMGTELACKSWLSGGRMILNRSTWFAHFFRVGGHGFPYPIKGSEQDYARRYSQNLWRGNNWPRQRYPLRWLVDKFWPVPGWREEDRDALPCDLRRDLHRSDDGAMDSKQTNQSTDGRINRRDRGFVDEADGVANRAASASVGIVYYSHGKGDPSILTACREQLVRAAGELPIVSVTLQPLAFGRNIVLKAEAGILTMFRQILAGLEALDTDHAFLAEHDVLYHESHFQFRPSRDDVYFYNLKWWKVDAKTGRAVTYTAKQTSQLCANRRLLVEHYRKRVALVESQGFSRKLGFEPGSHRRAERVDDYGSDVWRSAVANIDVRHDANLTPSRWSVDAFRDQRNCQNWREADGVDGWGRTKNCFPCLLRKLGTPAREQVAV